MNPSTQVHSLPARNTYVGQSLEQEKDPCSINHYIWGLFCFLGQHYPYQYGNLYLEMGSPLNKLQNCMEIGILKWEAPLTNCGICSIDIIGGQEAARNIIKQDGNMESSIRWKHKALPAVILKAYLVPSRCIDLQAVVGRSWKCQCVGFQSLLISKRKKEDESQQGGVGSEQRWKIMERVQKLGHGKTLSAL